MNAAVVSDFNKPPQYASFTDPVPAQGEKLVKVTAAALPPLARAVASGKHYTSSSQLPAVPGVDGVGTLEDGTRVYFQIARPPFGTFAEYSVAKVPMCLPLPAGISDIAAAGMGNAAMSSSVALNFRAKFVSGESVLILGATGVAGKLAIQIAKRNGARRVVAAGRNAQALRELKALGADATISLETDRESLVSAFKQEAADFGIDVVLDYLWGAPAEAALEALSHKVKQPEMPRVRYVQIGETAGRQISLAGATLRSSGIELLGSGFGGVTLAQMAAALAAFFASAAQMEYVFRTKTVPLQGVESVWDRPEQGVRLVFQP